jgi:hypothetical protein
MPPSVSGDGKRREASATLVGDLATFPAYDVCQLLTLARATGSLFLRAPGVRGAIYLEDGAVVGARLKPNPRRLGELLVGAGQASESGLAVALARKVGGDRRALGEILVEDGALSARGLAEALVIQAREALAALLVLPAGRFAFTRRQTPPGVRRLAGVDPQSLLLDTLTRMDEVAAGRERPSDPPIAD